MNPARALFTSDDQRAAPSPAWLFFRTNAPALVHMLIASLLINALALALPLYSMLIYDKAVGNEIHDTLWALTLGMGLALLLESALRCVRVFMIEHAGARWDARLDERLVRGILAAPVSRSLRVGDMLARYRDLSSTRDVLSAQFLLPLADLPFVLLFAAAMWSVGGVLVLVPLVFAVLLCTVTIGMQALARSRQTLANNAHSSKLGVLADVLAARESLADPQAATAAVHSIRPPSLQGARAGSRARLWHQLSQQVVPLGLATTSVATLACGVLLVEARALSVGGLISCVMLAGRIVMSCASLVPLLSRAAEFRLAMAGLSGEVDLNATPVASTASGRLQAHAFQAEGLRVEGVRVSYTAPGAAMARSVLDTMNLRFDTKELVAVVGSSGAGKSTLLRILAGQLPPTEGRVVCAGHVVNDDERRRWLAAQVAYKPQEAVFLGGTLANAVAPSQAQPDEAMLVAALRAAGLGPALDRGELGLSTQVATNGAGLSGGQRHMLALARVLASPSQILLLDEPTAGLDKKAQDSLIAALLRRRADGRCVVVATHTAELIQLADRVVVIDGGRVVANAPPRQLFGGTDPASSSAATANATLPKARSRTVKSS